MYWRALYERTLCERPYLGVVVFEADDSEDARLRAKELSPPDTHVTHLNELRDMGDPHGLDEMYIKACPHCGWPIDARLKHPPQGDTR